MEGWIYWHWKICVSQSLFLHWKYYWTLASVQFDIRPFWWNIQFRMRWYNTILEVTARKNSNFYLTEWRYIFFHFWMELIRKYRCSCQMEIKSLNFNSNDYYGTFFVMYKLYIWFFTIGCIGHHFLMKIYSIFK